MLIYYINLGRRPDRREFMVAQFDRLGLHAVRIDAATPEDISAEERAAYCDPRNRNWASETTFCCNLSHMRAHSALLATREPRALILEDDAVLSPRLTGFLESFHAVLPRAYLVRLETALGPLTLWGPRHQLSGISVRRYVGWEGGSAAYIISREAAQIVLSSKTIRQRATDLALFDIFHSPLSKALQPYQANPALAIQADRLTTDRFAQSDLGQSRVQRPLTRWDWFRAFVHRDIVLAIRKAWHRFVLSGERRRIEYAKD